MQRLRTDQEPKGIFFKQNCCSLFNAEYVPSSPMNTAGLSALYSAGELHLLFLETAAKSFHCALPFGSLGCMKIF